MRKIFTTLKSVVAVALIAAMTLAASCSYDDSAIKERVSNVEKDLKALTDRVAALEKKLQTEVDSLKALIDGQVVVVDVITDAEGNQTIKLSDGKEITVLAPTQCTHECTPCDCDTLQYREINGVLEVSADGENWVAVNGVSADCVVANIVINDDNTATITLANGESFTVVKAELIEFEATRTQVYVAAGTTKAIPFSINDAVVAINVMNQPFGWSATVEEAVAEDDDFGMGILAAGGKNYVLKVNGPAQELVNAGYAAKEGLVSVHFNTAAGACKVANVAVTLAELTLNVDVAGNITITNSLATEQTNYWGEKFVDFADFWIGVMPKALYDANGNDALHADAGEWGDFMTSAVTQRGTGLYNIADLREYQEGVYEKETLEFTVDQLASAFWPTYNFEIGGEYIIFVATESELLNYYEIPVLDGALMAEYKKVLVEASLVEGSETWNDATFNFNLAGFQNFLIGWMSVAEVEMYMSYGMGSTIEEILPQFINAYGVMSSGAILAGNYLDQTIKLSELEALSLMQWAPSLATNTEYYFYVYPFNAQTEMEFYQHSLIAENLYYFGTFKTAALVAGEFDAAAQFEVLAHEEKEISVNVTLSEDVVSVAYNWYASPFMDPEEAVATIMGDEYYTTFATLDETKSFLAEDYDYYGLDNPTYLGIVAINANGEYVYVEKEFVYVEPVLPQVAITSFEFLGRSYDIDDDASTSGGDYVYALTCEDGTQYTLGLYYSYANEDGSIIEGTYQYRTNTLNAMYGSWSGFVVVSEETYNDSLLIVTADTITWKIKGVVEYVFNKNAQGGDEPVVPEDLIYTSAAKVDGGWTDFLLCIYGNDGTKIALNPMGMCNDGQHYFTPGTYYVNNTYGNFSDYFDWSHFEDAAGAQTGIYGGTIVISVVDGMYRFEMSLTVGSSNEPFVAVFQGVIEGMDLPGVQGGDEPEQPEQPEEVDPSDLVWNYSYAYGDWDDCMIYVYSSDETMAIAMNFYGIIPYDKGFIPEGTYDFGSWYGAVYTGGYSYLYYFATSSKDNIYSGTVAVSEVNGKYRFVIDAKYGDTMKEFHADFEVAVDGLLLPSQYVEPEPEPEPEVTSFPAVRADYDFQMELYEYNSGDAEYAFWLYDANNNYIEVVSKFGPHTNWDTVNSSKIVIDGVESQATSLQTQKPNTWNCGAGELYFVVIATYADGTHVEIAAQLPATERNFLGEGSTYAPGSENPGAGEGGEEPEPEQPAEVVELNPTDWFKSYSGGNELELGWFDQDGYSIMIDFLMNPITPGTYTLTNGLSGMYTKYRGIGMTSCTVVVTDAGDGQLAFDVNFKAQIEGVFTDYHFTWVGDPTTL